MEAALLIVLVGELTAPLKPHLEQALPGALEERVELVAEAPPGRDVVWVTAPSRDEVVLTLHIANEPGDLRRELRFSRSDPLSARGRAVAFAIASMRADRKPVKPATPVAVEPQPEPEPVLPPPPPPPQPEERVVVPPPVSHWLLSARGFGALALPTVAWQGGGLLEAQYLFPFHLAAGVGASLSGGALDTASWLQPAMWVSGSVRFDTGAWIPRLSVGVGAMASLVSAKTQTSTWQPYFRAAADITWRFARPHGVMLGVAGNFTTGAVTLTEPITPGNGNGNGNANNARAGTSLGPAWVALELGYVVDF